MWIAGIIVTLLLLVGVSVWQRAHTTKLDRMRANGKSKGMDQKQIDALIDAEKFPLPEKTRPVLTAIFATFFGLWLFNNLFFYAEPGFVYHVRTIYGTERVVDSVGYSLYAFGRINDWKKAMTVQALPFIDNDNDGQPDVTNAEDEGTDALASANLAPLSVVMLDQVDSRISATTRYRIPTDREAFLHMAHEYRTPENLLRTALIPAFKETLQATGSLMAAEEYYSGRRTEFNAEFENQMQNGIYLVSRQQVTVDDPTAQAKATANAATKQQRDYDDHTKVKWIVKKQVDATGLPIRKEQKFIEYGISVIEARVTDLTPNQKFVERMQLKQQAAADRAIAQEKRVQEEEQKLLAIAKGDREVAEEQALARKVQIKKTTEADTTKQLALIEANKKLEQAEIDKQTAQIKKDQADIDAMRIKVLAEADKYEREARIAGDNALDKKLAAEIQIQEKWAQAYAVRPVPLYVFGSGSAEGGPPLGGDREASLFMNLMTMDAAKRLAYDRGVPAVADAK